MGEVAEEGDEGSRSPEGSCPKPISAETMGPLLDFYSDTAEAHASLMIACLFGLFGLLALVQNTPTYGLYGVLKIWSSGIYIVKKN
ncbi:MAG: hypothetical protein JSV57_01275 [Candidatus Bathyarchaeota archaeon]|nr:MAG: hypothetical protein JSV57_01275 [Candidatus Bathyarchaeota archaeon]